MKRNRIITALTVLVVALIYGFGFAAQRADLAGLIDGSASLGAQIGTNTPDTGSNVDIANFSQAALVVVTGVSDNVTGSDYVVLQDSLRGGTAAAWASVDSIAVDSVDNKYYDLSYKLNGRYLRALFRGTSLAADTIIYSATIIKSGGRVGG